MHGLYIGWSTAGFDATGLLKGRGGGFFFLSDEESLVVRGKRTRPLPFRPSSLADLAYTVQDYADFNSEKFRVYVYA